MGRHDELLARIRELASTPLIVQQARTIRAADDVDLLQGARQIRATFAYADLADSTALAIQYPNAAVAKIYKSFLSTATRVFRLHRGVIRSFDGDRVMGIFWGDRHEERAVKAALELNGIIEFFLKPALSKAIDFIRENRFVFRHRVGIDSGPVMAVRVGEIRNNDLSWVGGAPNIAAKFAALNYGPTIVSEAIYNALPDDLKWFNARPCWTRVPWEGPVGQTAIYFSAGTGDIDVDRGVLNMNARWLERGHIAG